MSKIFQLILARFISPHLILVMSCAAYMVLGALALQYLEGQNLLDVKKAQLEKIDDTVSVYIDKIWHLSQMDKGRHMSDDEKEAVAKQVSADSKEEFDKFVDRVFIAHRHFRHGYDTDAPTWDFMTSLFFTATMLTSIGYGYVAPSTENGRMFVVFYCLIGIPLTLVTVANVAKFISETVFLVHYELWKYWMRWRQSGQRGGDGFGLGSDEGGKPMFDDDEDEQDILDRVRLVRFPPFVVFIFVFLYGLFGAYVIHTMEKWTYTESMYFTFISILTVGFGDYRPESKNLGAVLIVIMGGIVLTTMGMDVIGRMYLKEIHYLGRKLQTSNPFYLIREAKARRRRQAMASLLAQLARGMIFAHRNFNELSNKKGKKKDRLRGSQNLPDGRFMFARQPPDPPSECQVVSTSAYSVRLAWSPAFSNDADITYNIRYRLKHNPNSKIRELRGITGHTAEIMSVESCSLYEFRITAVSKFGESKPIYLVQYTEPQLSPQHVVAKRLNQNTVELSWEPPFKRAGEVKNYIVYFTENPADRLGDWDKVTVYGRKVVFPDLRYDWFYVFSATVVFTDGQRSPLSRALFIKTDKLEFNRQYVGHSRTIEIMESIKMREVDNEKTPLIKRDYVSFAV